MFCLCHIVIFAVLCVSLYCVTMFSVYTAFNRAQCCERVVKCAKELGVVDGYFV